MKIWNGYGSEHSANIVMIGKFKTIEDAEKAMNLIDQLKDEVDKEVEKGKLVVGKKITRYTSRLLELYGKLNLPAIMPSEFEQFRYDVSTQLNGSEIRISTDETEISAFMKILVLGGAKVEIFSAHDYSEENE